jgi:hypothetical protein
VGTEIAADRGNRRRRGRWRFVLASFLFAAWLGPASAQAQEAKTDEPVREAAFEWDADLEVLVLSMSFREVIDSKIQEKLRRGLPTTIVLTATIFRAAGEPLSTTAHTCKVTWHVWEEAYRVEVTRPGSSQVRWTTTIEGVLRRCAEVRRLLAGDHNQIPKGTPVYASGKVQVNPISPEVLKKIQRWVMRPASTGTAAPGDALFSTFTGLFLQRIGDAEREVKFVTRIALPKLFRSRESE